MTDIAITPEDRARLIKGITYLSNKSESKLKQRSGLLNGARVSYFRGKNAVGTDRAPPIADFESMVLSGYLVRVEKLGSGAGKYTHLQVSPIQHFDQAEYYVFAYHPTNYMQVGASIGLVLVVLAGIMFPLWPASIRQWVVYLSYFLLFILGLLFVLAVIRLIIYCGGYIVGKPGWLFPNLFADVSVIDSFKPVWVWEVPKQKSRPAVASSFNTTTAAAGTGASSDSAAAAEPLPDKPKTS